MHHKTTILVAPALQNISCTHPRYSQASFLSMLGPGDVLQAFIVLMLTVGVLAANVLLILVINSRRYSKYIHSQPRYLLTSLASNDLAMGLLVTPFAVVPSLRHCWPYGELWGGLIKTSGDGTRRKRIIEKVEEGWLTYR
ncbi:hypothetical protein Zmor_000070 [Zophobas morio]|uniref:G-protein coupled receptors family 1 profile domain-containing protein n=1 Tax=Zophobas morio TaxID=2755281 RepID=A0AA38IYN3_9CUCU|nr:hypothetical protein Zmor_000070 [Zophobas morio]